MGPDLYRDRGPDNSDPGQLPESSTKGRRSAAVAGKRQKKSGATQGWRPFLAVRAVSPAKADQTSGQLHALVVGAVRGNHDVNATVFLVVRVIRAVLGLADRVGRDGRGKRNAGLLESFDG